MKRFIVFLFGLFLSAISYADTCTQSQIDLGNSECIDTKFSITTSNLSVNTEFRFLISATGTFYVDCGDDGILSNVAETDDVNNKQITRSNFAYSTYKCAYSTGGIKTIKFAGRATGYNSSTNATAVHFQDSAAFINQIDGCLGAIFPTLGTAKDQQPRFRYTFSYAQITSIPEELFNGVIGGNKDEVFLRTFANTKITSIPENLFAGFVQAHIGSFAETFAGCKNLTNIPQKLFSNVSQKGNRTDWLFFRTFYGCSSLTHIPENLFANISVPSGQLFGETFSGCTSLSGIIPPSLFSGLITNNSPYTTDMMKNTFANTNLDTTCPTGTTQYITGYEDYWDGKVSCAEDAPHVCSAGEYLPKFYNSCAVCPRGKYCTGGTYSFSPSADQGLSGNITAGYFGNGGTKVATPTSSDCLSGYTCGTCREQTGPNGRPLYTSAAGGASACDECPAVNGEFASRATGRHGYYPSSRNNGVGGCLASFNDTDDDATFRTTCYYNAAYNNYETGQCHIYEPTSCAAGRYDTIRQNTEWGRFGDNAAGCIGVDCMNGKVCTATDPGYYSPEGATTQTPCASGTYSPSGSAICYPHILHIGDNNVYLKSTKQTTPSLNIKIGNDIFYAHMTTVPTKMNKDSTRYFRVQWPDNDYYVCDDTTCPQ